MLPTKSTARYIENHKESLTSRLGFAELHAPLDNWWLSHNKNLTETPRKWITLQYLPIFLAWWLLACDPWRISQITFLRRASCYFVQPLLIGSPNLGRMSCGNKLKNYGTKFIINNPIFGENWTEWTSVFRNSSPGSWNWSSWRRGRRASGGRRHISRSSFRGGWERTRRPGFRFRGRIFSHHLPTIFTYARGRPKHGDTTDASRHDFNSHWIRKLPALRNVLHVSRLGSNISNRASLSLLVN